jgi:hypothetical protein
MEPIQTVSSDPHPDWARLLPRVAYHEIMRVFHGSLPPPDTDAPEDWAQRDRAAMAAVGAMSPANAAEARMAAQSVLATSWAADCLRLAAERRLEIGTACKCKAQAASFMREARGAELRLEKMQAKRAALAKDDAAASEAAWVEHAALGMMGEALVGEALVEAVAAADEPDAPARDEGTQHLPVEVWEDGGRNVAAGVVSEFGFAPDSRADALDTRSETNARRRAPAFPAST